MSSMFLKNLLTIPAILALAVSGMKLYKSIMQDRRRENIKQEIIRHSLFSLFILVVFIVSSFIEAFVSTNFLKYFLKFI